MSTHRAPTQSSSSPGPSVSFTTSSLCRWRREKLRGALQTPGGLALLPILNLPPRTSTSPTSPQTHPSLGTKSKAGQATLTQKFSLGCRKSKRQGLWRRKQSTGCSWSHHHYPRTYPVPAASTGGAPASGTLDTSPGPCPTVLLCHRDLNPQMASDQNPHEILSFFS